MKPEATVGMAMIGGMTTGLAGLLVAVLQLIRGDGTGAGLGLIAAALAFGFAANAALRD